MLMESRYGNFESLSPDSGNQDLDSHSSNEGISSIKGIPSYENLEHPIPRPENPETYEVSQTPETKPSRDDGHHFVINY